MKLIAAGQRIQRRQMLTLGRIWSSGYVVAKNGIDIEDAFFIILMPGSHWGYRPWEDDYGWLKRGLMHTRSRGWEWREFFA